MNNKGFTLVELLGVIVILALLALLTSISVTKLVKDTKNDLSDIQITSIKLSAEIWGAENISKLPNINRCKYITLKDLKNEGLLDTNIIDPKTNTEINEQLKIKITATSNENGNPIYTYEVNPTSIEGCNYAIMGDVNNDGAINAQDAIDLSYYLFLGTKKDGTELPFPTNGDMNDDGNVQIVDVNILSTNLGLITSTYTGSGLLGDANGNGLIEESDSNLVLEYNAKLIFSNQIVLNNSDVNNDGDVGMLDVVSITRKIANK